MMTHASLLGVGGGEGGGTTTIIEDE